VSTQGKIGHFHPRYEGPLMIGHEIIGRSAKAFHRSADEVVEGAKKTREFSLCVFVSWSRVRGMRLFGFLAISEGLARP
jgi:hypothetical protein